jgi:epoxide hydrolase 4
MNENVAHWRHQFVQANHIKLHCVTQGTGDLVLLLHGFPEFWYSWRYQIPVVSRYFQVVVPDLRGYNDSDKPGRGYDLETLTQDIVELIHSLGYERAHIVGHDWGGVIGWNVAQKFPDLVQSLVVLSAPHPGALWKTLTSSLEQFRKGWPYLAFQVPAIPEWLLQQNLAGFLRDWFQQNAIRKAAFSTETLGLYHDALAKKGALSAALNYYRQWLTPGSWWARLQEKGMPIQVPTLLLWGAEDSVLSPGLKQELEPLFALPPRLKIIPDCGHWIQQEVPQLVNLELLNFLKPLRSSEGSA